MKTRTALGNRARAAVVRQFGHPRGIGGRLAGWVMAHRDSNVRRNRWAVSLLDVRPEERVLEIGFGPGVAIAELARHATSGRVYGVDMSAVMAAQAARRNSAAIRAGRVELVRTSVDRLPDLGEPLDAVLAVNNVGFWPDPAVRLRGLRHMLRPGGRIALVSQPRSPGADGTTTERAGRELHELLVQGGFTPVRTETLDLDPPAVCVLARNEAAGEAG